MAVPLASSSVVAPPTACPSSLPAVASSAGSRTFPVSPRLSTTPVEVLLEATPVGHRHRRAVVAPVAPCTGGLLLLSSSAGPLHLDDTVSE